MVGHAIWTIKCPSIIPKIYQQSARGVDGHMCSRLLGSHPHLRLPRKHQGHVHSVLQHLWKAGLYANPKKCKFHTDTVEYLGFILSLNGLQMDPSKVAVIMEWPEPQKVKDVQAFLEFANFYHRFIHGYAELTLPLTKLCKKNSPWHFRKEEVEAFNQLKNAFTTALVLTNWSPKLPMTVEMDTSDGAIAGIILVTTLDN